MMWTMIVLALTLFKPAVAVADVSGSWAVMGEVSGDQVGGSFSAACTFQQKDANIEGVCKRASGDVDVSGHVNEKGVSFQYDIDNGGVTRTFLFNGTLDKDAMTMTGEVSLSGVGEGKFTAKKEKK